MQLQQDRDILHWKVDIQAVKNRCDELHISHIRRPVSVHTRISTCSHVRVIVQR